MGNEGDRGIEFTYTPPTNFDICPVCTWFGLAQKRAKERRYAQSITQVELLVTCGGTDQKFRHLLGILHTTPPLQNDHNVTIYTGTVPCPGAMSASGDQYDAYAALLK